MYVMLCFVFCSHDSIFQADPQGPVAPDGRFLQQAFMRMEHLRERQGQREQQAGEGGEQQAGAAGVEGHPLDLQQVLAQAVANLQQLVHRPQDNASSSEEDS